MELKEGFGRINRLLGMGRNAKLKKARFKTSPAIVG